MRLVEQATRDSGFHIGSPRSTLGLAETRTMLVLRAIPEALASEYM
jgi:hypothetical protein